MSIRKGLTLLLLAVFGLSSVTPALSITVNEGETLPVLTLDQGQKSQGAKPVVQPASLVLELDEGELLFSNNVGEDEFVKINSTGTASIETIGALGAIAAGTGYTTDGILTQFNTDGVGAGVGFIYDEDGDASSDATIEAGDLTLFSIKAGTAAGDVVGLAGGNNDATVTIGTISTGSLPNGTRVSFFVPQDGCSFVPLPGYKQPNESISMLDYTNALADKDADGVAESGPILRNVSITTGNTANKLLTSDPASTAAAPNDDNVALLAYVLGDDADDVADGNSSVAAGALALYTVSSAPSETISGSVAIEIDNIGIACDAGTNIEENTVTVTIVDDTDSAFNPALNVDQADRTFTIATTAEAPDGKLEVYLADGSLTGTDPEDDVTNTVLGSAILNTSNDTVSFGPGEFFTNSATATILDIDTIKIRAAETPDSTVSSKKYFQTPLATAKFVNTGDQDMSAIGDLAKAAVLGSSSFFQGSSNALITVSLQLLNASDAASDASLTISDVFVGLPSGSANLDSDSVTVEASGFLGALVNPVRYDTDTADTVNSTALATNADQVAVISVLPDDTTPTIQDGYGIDSTKATLSISTGVDENLNDANLRIYGAIDSNTAAQTFIGNEGNADNALAAGNNVDPFILDNTFLFPGVTFDDLLANGTTDGSGTVNEITAKSVANGGTTSFSVESTSGTLDQAGEVYRNTSEVFARLQPTGNDSGTVYHMIYGVNTASANVTDLVNELNFKTTDLSEDLYSQSALVLNDGDDDDDDTLRDNMIMASRVTKVGSRYDVTILPFVNKYQNITDTNRDLITIRPKGSIDLGTNSKTNGVKLVASVSGNNISGTQQFTLLEIQPSSIETGLSLRTLPVNGSANALLAHKSDDPTSSRTTIDPNSVNTTNTDIDAVVASISSELVLDTTVPPLFAAGVVGNGASSNTRGAIPGIQPKKRVIAIEETTAGQFKSIDDLGNTVNLRLTFPANIDLAGIDANTDGAIDTEQDTFGLFTSNGVTIANVQTLIETAAPISATNDQAYLDLDLSAGTYTTDDFLRGIYLVIDNDALAISTSASDLNVKAELVRVDGDNVEIIDDLGNVPLASSLSQMFNVTLSDAYTSTFTTSSAPISDVQNVRSDIEATLGSQGIVFANSVPSSGKRFITGATGTVSFVDLKVEEAVPDAIPLGADVDGISSTFINGVAAGTLKLYCASSERNLFEAVSSEAIVSDDSIAVANEGLEQDIDSNTGANDVDALVADITPGAAINNSKAFAVTSSVTFKGIEINVPSLSGGDPDIYCWLASEEDANNIVNIATNVPVVLAEKTINSVDEFAPIPFVDGGFTAGANADDNVAKTFFQDNGEQIEGKADFAEANELAVFNNAETGSAKLVDAVDTVIDSASLGLLTPETVINVVIEDLPTVNGVVDTSGDKSITICSNADADLEPGTLVTVATNLSGVGEVTDTITVPVLADGTFQAVVRALPGQAATIQQLPNSNSATQIIGIEELVASGSCADTNPVDPEPGEDPVFAGTVPTLLTSSLVEGQIVVLFDAPSTTNFTFADVETTATVNGVAVEKLGDRFAAVVSTTETYTLAVTVDGETVSTTLDVTTTDKTRRGSIRALRTLRTDKNDRFVLRQRRGRLPNDLNLELVFNDGTIAVVNNADLSRNRRGVVRFDNPESDKTISFVQLISAKRGSRVAEGN
ncbi:MAG: hypothetical protein HRT47_13270 [Candidatus Caenarcaniphilales bacterium]|nr:hypothetical protein [Candidatus Caenarcaniphilales bacterium]